MKYAVLGVLILLSLSSAVFENMESGTRAEGMAGAFTAVGNDACTVHFNPAGLSQIDRINVYTFYELLFGGIGENLHNATLNAAVPFGRAGTLGVSVQEMGFALSSERSLTAGYGVGLLKDLSVGAGLVGYNLYMKDMGSAFALGIDLGLHARLYRRWTVGFSAHNLNMPQMGTNVKTYLPRVLNVGLAYTPADGIVSALDVSKEVGQPTRVAVGGEFRIVENLLTLRAGVLTEPVRLAVGLGTGTRNIHLDYALLTHSSLPATHNLGLSVVF